MMNLRRAPLLLSFATLLLGPLPAFAQDGGMLLPDDMINNMPVGRVPDRPEDKERERRREELKARLNGEAAALAAAPAPVAAPDFKLSPPAQPEIASDSLFKPETFTLPNGLAFVVIPNHRAPIVSHMVWYQVGAADEPLGKSGLAHLLEHLMFKGTPTVTDGQFSRRVMQNGGEDNAFTSWDYTAYFQNIAKDRLELVMQLEADRMANLTLADAQVASEREVVMAERQQREENDPLDRLREAMRAAFFVHHPYGRPIVGWGEEIKNLKREDALAFYRTWYSPANAIVVISGDVTAEELKPIAERTFGQVVARAVPARQRVVEPVLGAERRVVLKDDSIMQPVFMRSYYGPAYRTGDKTAIAALQVLSEVLGGGPTSRLYRRLVMDLRLATSVRFDYDPVAFDTASASLAVMPAPGQDIGLVETALDAVTKDLLVNGISEAELLRAKKRLLDSSVFARDSVQAPAYIFGMTLAAGGDISDVEAWPGRIMAVSAADVQKAAAALFDQKGYVTGLLLPTARDPAAAANMAETPAGGMAPSFNEREQH